MKKPLLKIRNSIIHGFGAFATTRIRKDTRIVEYVGEIISSLEGDRRYDDSIARHPHVLLFSVDECCIQPLDQHR